MISSSSFLARATPSFFPQCILSYRRVAERSIRLPGIEFSPSITPVPRLIRYSLPFKPEGPALLDRTNCLPSKSLRRILDHNQAFLDDAGEVTSNEVSIRFIDTSADKWWREIRENGKRAVTRKRDVDSLLAECLARPNARQDLVVVRDISQQPTRWFIPEIA